MPPPDTNDDVTLALSALVWTLGDGARAQRLLDLTGLSADTLRASAGSPGTLAAALAFLEGHEPDLVACADALGVSPARLVAARTTLEQA